MHRPNADPGCDAEKGVCLGALPVDVLIEIMEHLDILDIIKLRQLSWLLYNVMKARPVWLRLFYLESLNAHRTIYLEKTLESHSAYELEIAVLKPRKANRAWLNRDPSIRKAILHQDDHVDRILPGGRWLLASSLTSVVCYDLASLSPGHEQPARSILVTNPLPILPGTHIEPPVFNIDTDNTTPYLTFNLVVHFIRSDLNIRHGNYQGPEWPLFQIWRIVPQFSPTGRIEGLIPQHMCTLGHSLITLGVEEIHLRERHIAYRGSHEWVLTNWKDMPPPQGSRPNRVGARYGVHRILSGDRVLVCESGGELYVYRLPPTCTPVLESKRHLRVLTLLWTGKVPFSISPVEPAIRGPFPSRDGEAFILLGSPFRPTPLLLTVPHNFTSPGDSNPPRIETLFAPPTQPSRPLEGARSLFHTWAVTKFALVSLKYEGGVIRCALRLGMVPPVDVANQAVTSLRFYDFVVPSVYFVFGKDRFIHNLSIDDTTGNIALSIVECAGPRNFALVLQNNFED